jgi:hypothetical protein
MRECCPHGVGHPFSAEFLFSLGEQAVVGIALFERADGAAHTRSAPLLSITVGSGPNGGQYLGDGIGQRYLAPVIAGPVPQLHDTGYQPASDDQNGGHPDQFGVGEFDSRRCLAVIEEHPHPGRDQFGGDPVGFDPGILVLAGCHDVHIGGCYLTRPDQA